MSNLFEDAGYISLSAAMSQANYIPEHNVSQDRSMDFLLQKLIKINQESEDPRLSKLISFIKVDEFDSKLIKVAIAILLDISLGEYTEDILSLAYFSEEEMDKDEKDTFVSILLSEIKAGKKVVLDDFCSLSVNKNKDIITASKSSINIEDSIYFEDEKVFCPRNKKVKKNSSHAFIVHKSTSNKNNLETIESEVKPRTRKRGVSSRQKILSVLGKHQSFLIYQEAFTLPKGIKRIRVKESFDEIITFIKKHVSETNLPVDVVVEENKAKVLFKDNKIQKQKKQRNKVNIRIFAA